MKLRPFALLQRTVLPPRTLVCSAPKINSLRVFPASRSYASISAAHVQFGQPVHETHPHLLKAGEITPGISALEYSDRRAKLAASLPDNCIAILSAAGIKYRSGSVFYDFHQESNFFYLTGFNEPDAIAIIQKAGLDGDYVFHLFVRPKDAKAEQWEGARSGEQAALDVFNADYTGDINNLSTLLPPLIKGASEVYTDIPTMRTPLERFFGNQEDNGVFQSMVEMSGAEKLRGALNEVNKAFQKMIDKSKVKPLKNLVNNLRAFKSEAEVKNMRYAGQVSGRAFTSAMKRQFEKEKDLTTYLDYKFKIEGCDGSAYVPVVAGGRNARSIHYVRNDDMLRNGQMVLVDAGGEYGGYITDITRTWPISGKFTPAQKDLYSAILKVQRSTISLCRESSNLSLDKLHEITRSGLKTALEDLGFDMKGNAIDVLFPHHVGHYVGLDVHDCPGYPRSEALKAGQCVTVEPGIYVPDDTCWPQHFRGMGIRIEDSICVQDDSPLILTTEAVKEVDDIEALRG